MRKFAVIGLGQYGYQLAVSLAELGADVLGLDRDEHICETIKRVDGVHPLCLDATDENALRSSGIEDVDAAIVAIGQHLEVSIVVTALLKRMAIPTIARSSSDLHEQILQEVGAQRVYNPEKEMGVKAAQEIFVPDLHDRMTLSSGHTLAEVDARKPLWGKSLSDLDFRGRFGLHVIALKTRRPAVDQFGENTFKVEVNPLPSGSDVIEEGDILVVVGMESRVREFLEL
jgi:trk system potassium uptake protein TrkA